tara:strand:- start:327 stop:440 length:114 start_codon:yes stop_codon:yes gene_type:complete
MAFKYSPMKPAAGSASVKPRKKKIKKPTGIRKTKKLR